MNKYLQFIFNSTYRFDVLDCRGYYKKWSDEKYLKRAFRAKYHRMLDLNNPQTYNEKLQWLKLYYRRPEYTYMVDKYEMKEYVSKRIGEEYVIPTLGVWDRYEEIDFANLPDQFVLKCTHDSGGLIVCRDKGKLDFQAVKIRILSSLNRNYYYFGREWPYKDVVPRIIAEEYMSSDNDDLIINQNVSGVVTVNELQKRHGLLDYKFMCFDGKVRAIFLDIGVIGSDGGHSSEYYRNIYDSSWNKLPVHETREWYPIDIMPPPCLSEMVRLSEILSAGHPHLRVDMYYVKGNIYIGELTFFHGSGLSNKFIPESWDYTFGSWIKLPSETYEF